MTDSRATASSGQWRDIPGYEGLYMINAKGVVLSLGRITIGGSPGGPCQKQYQRKFMRQQTDKDHRNPRVPLRDRKGKTTKILVSRLLAQVWGLRSER